MTITLYHNPRCSKSRQTLALLTARGVEPDVVDYLKTPPDRPTLEALSRALRLPPSAFIRKKEPEYADLGLGPDSDDDAFFEAMVAAPKLLERPILVVGDRAAIGRPPENVLPLVEGLA